MLAFFYKDIGSQPIFNLSMAKFVNVEHLHLLTGCMTNKKIAVEAIYKVACLFVYLSFMLVIVDIIKSIVVYLMTSPP